jgi:hypothetical protein
MPSLKLSTIVVLLALLALASIALALPGPGTCTCAKNGAKGDVASCDTADCYNFCKGKGATGTESCVTKPKRAFATETSPVTETEAFMVQKAMFAIPCDLCEVTVADVQKIPEASCVTALDNACKVVQNKFPDVKCSTLLETLACGVVRTLLVNLNPQEVCTKYARCQVPTLEMQPQAPMLQAKQAKPVTFAVQGVTGTVKCSCAGTNSKGVAVSVSEQVYSTEGCLPCFNFCGEQAALNDVLAWNGQSCGPVN